MSESRELAWSDNSVMDLSTDGANTYLAEQYTTDFFAKANGHFTQPGPISRSYDSLPSNSSAGQLFEVASNDGSIMGSSTFNDSSASSSRFGTRQDSFSDIQSRKASMSSTYDGTISIPPDRSPEALVGRRGSWYPTEEQMNVNYNLPYGKQASTMLNQESHVPPEITSFQRAISHNCTSPTQLVHARSYSAAANYAHDKKSTAKASTSSLLLRNHSLSLPQPLTNQSNSHDPSIPPQEEGLKTDQENAFSRNRSSTAGSTRKLKFKRSRTGCMVCRKRKVKCDQDGLPCKQCRIGKRECHYEDNPPKRRRKSKVDDELSAESVATASQNEQMLPPTSAQSLSNLRARVESSRSEQRSTKFNDTEIQEHIANSTAREEEEELKRKTDALFAQHTNIDEVGGEDTIVGEGAANSFSLINGKPLGGNLLSAASIDSMGSTSIDSAISDQNIDSSFEANFANLTNHANATTQLDFKQSDGQLASSFSTFANFNDQDADHVNYGSSGDGNVHW